MFSVKFRKLFLILFIILSSTVAFAGDGDTCDSNEEPEVISTHTVESILNVAHHVVGGDEEFNTDDLKDLSSEENDFSLLDNVGTCVNIASTGLTVNKAVHQSVKLCKKMGKNPRVCAAYGLNLARIGAQMMNVKASALKIPTLGLKLSNCSSITDRLTCSAQLIGSSAVLTSSLIELPYVKTCGKALLVGTKLCKDVSCLAKSKTRSERWCYGIKAACNTASLISLFTPLSDTIETTTELMGTGVKVYKAAKSSAKLTAESVDKFVYKNAIDTTWTDSERSQFKADAKKFKKRTDYSNIQCKYQGKTYWAKFMDQRNSTQSTHYQSKGRWIRVQDDETFSYVFALKDHKRDVVQACKLAILLEEDAERPFTKKLLQNEFKKIDSDEIGIFARSHSFSYSYPTAITLNKDSPSEYVLKVISR